jgi:hypothetical protein
MIEMDFLNFIKSFVAINELWGQKEGKIRGRKVHIHGQIPALTIIGMASPRGLVCDPCKW